MNAKNVVEILDLLLDFSILTAEETEAVSIARDFFNAHLDELNKSIGESR